MGRCNRRTAHVALALALAVAADLVASTSVGGAPPAGKPTAGKPPATAPAPLTNEQLQAKAWSEFYAGRFEQAVADCNKLLSSPLTEPAKLEAAHCEARGLWSSGRLQPVSQTKARALERG